jgi:hypothetical protein
MTPQFEVPEWMQGVKPDKEDDDSFYYEIELTPRQRYALLDILNQRKRPPVRVTNSIIHAVAQARHIGTKLLRERLDWKELEREAKRQGCSVVDILFDRAHASEDA